jgi:protein SCO1/2
MSANFSLNRRTLLRLTAGPLGLAALAACGGAPKWHGIDVSGASPSLAFGMARAPDGKDVTEADYRGRVVMLYLGYTFCPDVCPTTLANIAEILTLLGPDAAHVSVLFVTVDPNRDTVPVLGEYVQNFAPQIVGLRGTPDQLAALARRYRLVYSVTPDSPGHPYEVTHSAAIYVFDGSGAAQFLVPTLASTTPDVDGTTVDLKRLIAESKSA